MLLRSTALFFFFFNDTATTEIYTLSLHDALPIYYKTADKIKLRAKLTQFGLPILGLGSHAGDRIAVKPIEPGQRDRKSTRLNSSHGYISYAVFCLKKKKTKPIRERTIACALTLQS